MADRLGLDIGDPETAHASRDLDEKGNWRRIITIIKTWLDNGVLDHETRYDERQRKNYEFFVPGDWNENEAGK